MTRPLGESIKPRSAHLSTMLRLAQTDETNKPAAEPEENPRGLEVPIVPDKAPAAEPNAPAAETPATPATPANPTTPATPPATEGLPPAVTPDEPTPGATEAEGREVVNARTVGNRVVPSDTILLQVATKPGVAYSSRQIQLDLAKIDTLGFFASVKHQVTPNLEDPTKVDVTFIVVENRVISGFRFEGNKSVKTEDLLKALQSKVGTVLNRNTVNSDIDKIRDLYQQRGYGALPENVRQAEDGTVIFTVQEATVSRVELSGLRKTKPSLIRKQIRVKPGDPLDVARIRKDLNRIYDMGFFEDVTWKPEPDPDKSGSFIVTIGLKEKRTGSLSLGVGFDSRSKISGFVTLSENNFGGTGKTASASVELGSQRTFDFGFSNPFVGQNNASYGASVYSRRVFREPRVVQIVDPTAPDTALFEEQRTGARLNYTHPLDQDHVSSLLFGYRNEKARLFHTDLDNTNPTPLGPESGRISALSFGFLHDGRDLRLDPSKGGREQLIVERAFSFLGGEKTFTKLDLDLRRYFPLMKPAKPGAQPKLVFAGRLVVGKSLGDLPAFEQYFVGGSDTVRGYDVDEQYGDNQIYSNLELRYRLQNKIQLVGFFDAGTAFGGPFSSSSSSDFLTSVGGGVRLQTPIGPIRLDIGFGKDGAKTSFGIGSTF